MAIVPGNQNFPDNVLYEMDNLEVLRGMNSETVDLIATDPPFNTQRNRAGTAGFYVDKWRWGDTGILPDQWKWNEVHPIWLDQIKDKNTALYEVIKATGECHGEDIAAFLCFLSVRLLEMHRVLKPTGSIYLHCDHTANAYIRMCMDAIFGKNNFRNEIVWWYYNVAVTSKRFFGRKHDTIFWYSKGRNWTFNADAMRVPYEESSGWFKNPSAYGDDRYAPDTRGKLATDVIPMPTINNMAKERTGSPDQKPLALYERIILASSNPGDLVLDPFAGCATTPMAARKHKRRWIGIDRRPDARFHVVCRLAGIKKKDADEIRRRPDLAGWLDAQLAKYEAHYAIDPPERNDDRETAAPDLDPVYTVDERSVFTHREMHAILVEQFGPICWGCNFNGSIYGERGPRYLELDHVDPKSQGGHDHLDNRALLCGPCNREKSDSQTVIQLRRSNIGAKAAKDHPIKLKPARQWCRARLRREYESIPKLGLR